MELAHEALIRCWPRLRGWLSEAVRPPGPHPDRASTH
ncbi:nSTAND1 domain-containing NTPase [Streptomyces gottesmaniae]